MDEAAVRDQPGEASRRPDPAPSEAGRTDALEQEVRLLTTRLAGWVEAQLIQALDDRRHEMQALRSELLFLVNEQRAAAQVAPAGGEVLEQRVRAAMSRLSDSVEARLAQEAENRRAELDAVRAGLEATVAAQTSKAEATLAAMQDLSGTSSTLGARVDEVASQAAGAAQASAAFRAEADALPERIEAFEQRVKAAMGRLTDSVETRLAETAAGRDPALDELRSTLRAGTARADALDEQLKALRSEIEADRESFRGRLDALAAQVTSATDGMAAAQAEIDAGPARAELLEQRVRSAVGRLAESMEARLSEAESGRTAEVTGLRTELETAVAALRARSTQVQERLDSVEQLHRDAGERLGQMVDVKLTEVVDSRRGELAELRRELEEALALQLREGRTAIGTAVADAHRRFVVSVDRLEEQMHVVSEQAANAQAAVARVELVPDAVASDGRRIEALEEHTRRTDARLSELVDAKLAELADQRLAEVDGVREELRTALDTHLAEIRSEVVTSLAESRTEAAAGTSRLEDRLAAIDELGRAVDASQRDAEERVEQALQARLTAIEAAQKEAAERVEKAVQSRVAAMGAAQKEAADRAEQALQASTAALDSAAADVAAGRSEVTKAVASLERKTARVREKVEHKVDALSDQAAGLGEQVAGLGAQVEALVNAAAKEAGALAPLRSDLRLLQRQVAELATTVAELGARRKPAATPAKKTAPAKKAAVTPAKAAARRRRVQ